MKKLLQSKLNSDCLSFVQKIAEFHENWKNFAQIEQDFYLDLKKTTIVTSAGASTRIEGATLSDEEIFQKLEGLQIQKINDRDEAEVAGYIDCKEFIFASYNDIAISEHSIRALHQMMMRYLAETIFPHAQKGCYKNVPNSVAKIDQRTGQQQVIFETTPPGPQTETAMRELIDDYNHYIQDPNFLNLEVIAAFVVKFLAIHPFRDGNGRISRLLTDLLLLKEGYEFCMYSSHERIIEETKHQYYVALRQTQSSLGQAPDINPWFLYFLKTLTRQTQYLNEKITFKKPGDLTEKEEVVLNLIQKHQPVSIGFLERESHFKRVTLKAILKRMQDEDLILMTGSRKSSRYLIQK